MNIPLDDVFHFDATTRTPGGLVDADSTPAWSVYEEDTDTAIQSGSMTRRSGLTGRYRGSVTCSAANGFEIGKWYSVQVSATVNTVVDAIEIAKLRCVPAETSVGLPQVQLSSNGLDEVALPEPADATDIKSSWINAMTWLFRRFAASRLTKSSETSASLTVLDTAGDAISTQAVSDDGTTQHVGEMA